MTDTFMTDDMLRDAIGSVSDVVLYDLLDSGIDVVSVIAAQIADARATAYAAKTEEQWILDLLELS